MRKRPLLLFIVCLSIALLSGIADAQVSGQCSQCHTMHNSQNGAPVAQDFSGNPLATAQNNLTVSTCLGCHNGQAPGAPKIFEPAAGPDRTAAGTFNSTVFTTDSKGHNVKDLVDAGLIPLAGAESVLTGSPPGAEAGGYTEPTGLTLTCAGTLGCHGNHDAGAGNGITGFHHLGSPPYRFLRYYDGASHTDVQGNGSADWEADGATATNHNVYYALSDDTDASRDSISSFCSMCHGDFHDNGDTSSGGIWTRHPTEVLVPAAWNATVDYERNPFAFDSDTFGSISTTAAYNSTTDEPKVACISCHRAHAWNDDILRFKYSDMVVGSGNTWGCLGCHTAQR